MRLKGRISAAFENEKDAKDAAVAVSHEGKGSGRAEMRMARKGKNIEIEVDAADAVAFRAMLNTLLRDFQAIEGELRPGKE